jgi:hypothetical protein
MVDLDRLRANMNDAAELMHRANVTIVSLKVDLAEAIAALRQVRNFNRPNVYEICKAIVEKFDERDE